MPLNYDSNASSLDAAATAPPPTPVTAEPPDATAQTAGGNMLAAPASAVEEDPESTASARQDPVLNRVLQRDSSTKEADPSGRIFR